jgi:hypothetical protein
MVGVLHSYGQIHNTIKVIKPKDKPMILSTISKSGDLYDGIPNKMRWVDTVLPSKKYIVKIQSNGWWINDTIDADANVIGDSLTIFICKTNGKDTVVLNIEKLAVHRIPDPVLCINGKQITGIVSKQDLLKSKKLSTFMSNDLIGSNSWFKIKSFDMQVNDNILHSDSPALSSIMLGVIRNSRGRIAFTQIKVLGPDGIVRFLNDYDLQLVQ